MKFIWGFAAGASSTVGAAVVGIWLVFGVFYPPVDGNPFPEPIGSNHEAIVVKIEEFASLPPPEASPTGLPARMMTLVDEPGTGRLFVNDLAGVLYSISYDGRDVVPYLDLSDPQWKVDIAHCGHVPAHIRHRCQEGFHSFAFHPQFSDIGTPGFGKLYTYVDTRNDKLPADFTAKLPSKKHQSHTILLEWQVRSPGAKRYDGDAPAELMRIEHPGRLNNGGQISFGPARASGSEDPDHGLLYVTVGSGRPVDTERNNMQDPGWIFGKFLRIDPLGSNSANGRYGIPADNPFADDGDDDTLGEVYAYGLRNPHRFCWDPRTGRLLVADIGDDLIEEISYVAAGANLGWSHWEGRYLSRLARRERLWIHPAFWLDALTVTWPVVEYDHGDPLLEEAVAVTGLTVYRDDAIPQLANLVLFGDLPSGEVFSFPADPFPGEGGQASIRRVLFEHQGETKTLLQMIRERTVEQGGMPASRADLRFGTGPNGWVFLLNKSDGIVRRLVPAR